MSDERSPVDMLNTIQFVLEIDKLKHVLRKVRPLDSDRYENTAEHSWQIALFALTLANSLGLSIDTNRVVGMLLVHDIGEIDAGDKLVFAEQGWDRRKAEELRSAERIFDIPSRETGNLLLGLWKEFEAGESPEARFARAIDRSMPVLLNLGNHAGSWLENGVTYERAIKRVGPEIENGCPALWHYLRDKLEIAHNQGFFALPLA